MQPPLLLLVGGLGHGKGRLDKAAQVRVVRHLQAADVSRRLQGAAMVGGPPAAGTGCFELGSVADYLQRLRKCGCRMDEFLVGEEI